MTAAVTAAVTAAATAAVTAAMEAPAEQAVIAGEVRAVEKEARAVEVEVTVDNFLLKIILEGAHLRHKDSNNRGCKLGRRGTWAHIILGDYAYL